MRTKFFMLMTLTAISFAFLLGGCSSGGGNNDISFAPDITTSESSMDFGNATIDNFVDRTLIITNRGGELLSIGQIAQLNPLEPPFEIISDSCSGSTARFKDSCTLKIRFSPSSQMGYNDSFDIPSNDPDEKSITVNVFGDGTALNVSINQVITDDCQNQKIKLIVTVTDKYGDAVTGLTVNEFTLFENDILQMITDVRQVQPPISTALAIDNSFSVFSLNWLSEIETAAKGFVDQMDASDEASVIKFGEDIIVYQGFTSDKDALKAAIDAPFLITKIDTLLYDAVWMAVDNVAVQMNERKAVIIISDGYDYGASEKKLTEVIDRALEKGIPVFTMGVGIDQKTDAMQPLADETGGQYYFAPQESDLQAICLQIADILSNQYVIEYNSSSSGSGIIILDLEVDDNNQQGEDSKESQGC